MSPRGRSSEPGRNRAGRPNRAAGSTGGGRFARDGRDGPRDGRGGPKGGHGGPRAGRGANARPKHSRFNDRMRESTGRDAGGRPNWEPRDGTADAVYERRRKDSPRGGQAASGRPPRGRHGSESAGRGKQRWGSDERARRDDRAGRDKFGNRLERDDRPRDGQRRGHGDDRRRGGGDRKRGGDRQRRDSQFYPTPASKPFEQVEDVVYERLAAEQAPTDLAGTTFADLGLGPGIVGALKGMGATEPFPIQAATIPPALEGRDVLGRGRTGSGKTIAFGAPAVEYLIRNRPEGRRAAGRPPRVLILAPTRELADQINKAVHSIARAVGIFTTLVTGGVPQFTQEKALQKGVDILIGTPGRIEDLVEQRLLDLGRVEIAVLDEADHMAELGFVEPVQRLLRQTRPDSQKLLFSATLDGGVATLIDEFLKNPAVFEVAGETQETSTIDHSVLVADRHDKDAVLASLAGLGLKSVFFTRTRAYAELLAERFAEQGLRVTSLHGDLSQNRRTRNLDRLKRGKVDVLVATDVAARGIHVDDIGLVVQADPPDEHKAYVHRAGRTGRAGAHGRVVTVIAPTRRRRMQQLLDNAQLQVPMIPVDATSDLAGLLGIQVDVPAEPAGE